MKDNVIVQFVVLGLSVTAFQLLLKLLVSYFPTQGFLGSIRAVVTNL